MMTTANYVLVAYVGGEQYHFEYEDCGDMWTALEQFWHEDHPETLIDKGGGLFPIDVIAMDDGKAIRKYEFMFNAGVFHAFFDHGHTAEGIYTLGQFAKDIERKSDEPDVKQLKAMMDRLADFCYSHPPYDEVILWMVGGSKTHYLYQHFCSKFNHLCSVCHEDTMSAWIKFYRELDDQWAERLMEYVYCEWKKK